MKSRETQGVRGPLGRFATAVAVLGWLAAASADADPRWWWDDRPVGSVAPVSDVDVAVVAQRGLPLVIFVAWVEPPTLIQGSLQLTASFDGGCTFCPPVHLESLFGPDDDIAIAATPFLRGVVPTAAIAIVHSASGRLQVIHDAGSIPLVGPPDCSVLQAVALGAIRTPLSPGDAFQPDVAAVTEPATALTEFHAVWHQIAPTDEEQVAHARDLFGDGSGWEVRPALPTDSPLFSRIADPHVSLDLLAPSGTAVNVVWTAPEFNQVLSLRSVDSGDLFSGTGAPPAGSPTTVAQAGLGISGPVAFDSGSSSRTDPPWHGALFFQDRGPGSFLLWDAQHQRGPSVADPAWGMDLEVTPFGARRDQGLAASVLPGGPAGEPQPAWLFWTDSSPATGAELFARGGVLDSDAGVPVDLDAPAFPPVRPGDPAVSVPGAMTHCRTDPALGDCVPDRLAGTAGHPASADGLGDVFVAWIDDRDGTPAVWFKRTDRAVDAPAPSLAVECSGPAEARITATFDQLPGCGAAPAAAERVRRYLVYYGLDPAGPYENTDLDGSDPGVPDTIVVVDDGGLVDPVAVEIDGLQLGATYHVVVVPEDEAGNASPPDFDPLADGATAPANERSIDTPASCGPPGPCLFRATAASRDVAATHALFAGTRNAEDVAFAPPGDLPYGPCPFAPGEADPEPVLDPGTAPVAFYQVAGAGVELRVAKDVAARTVRISY